MAGSQEVQAHVDVIIAKARELGMGGYSAAVLRRTVEEEVTKLLTMIENRKP